ncbi:hypothetical protein WJX75_008223 [Coccomyxa subellipsoidea]|uniref:RNI-like protein n=1 Tax=Coccomyxa subellipsoidea TaxID=248742 RepID=A0ABR2YFC6_9CHLO
MEASSLLPDSACPLPAHSSKDAFLHPNSHETKLLEGIVVLRTSSVDALLPFPRVQQVQSECDPASKPCSSPDSPAHSAATSPFHRSAKGVARSAGRLMQRLKPEGLEGPRLAQRFPHLRALDLSHCLHTVTFHTQTALLLRSNVTDELVGQLSPLTNLRELSLRGCTGLTGAPTSGFARILAFARLECLDISNCKLLQDDALKVVGRLPGLRQLRAVGCAALTDSALRQLSALQGLVQLDLGCNAHITDAGIAALATMQGLEQVNLVNLAQVTNTGVMALAALPNLKRTTVARCAHICESGLQEHFAGKQLRVSMCGTPLRRSMSYVRDAELLI